MNKQHANKQHIVEDAPSLHVPHLGWEDYDSLNRQTAYNHSAVKRAQACGCFRCGSTFASNEISAWLAEDDGEDSALCPYCETDAVIVGTETHPLSTALLSLLYTHWFSSEYKERLKKATYVPDASSREDYLRKGVPFLLACDPNVEVVGEIRLFPLALDTDENGECYINENYESKLGKTAHHWKSGIVSVYLTREDPAAGDVHFITSTEEVLPYEPWSDSEMALVGRLVRRYGDALKGVFIESGVGKMKLIVDRSLCQPATTIRE